MAKKKRRKKNAGRPAGKRKQREMVYGIDFRLYNGAYDLAWLMREP